MRMPGDNPVPSVKNRYFAWKLWTVEAPVRMLCEFFVSFIRVVDRMKERFGISDVNRYRNAESATLLPDRIQTGIIYCNQLACLVLHAQAKIFQYFQAAGSPRDGVIKLRDHFLPEVAIVNLSPVNLFD